VRSKGAMGHGGRGIDRDRDLMARRCS